jgi:hypothetical protein
VRYVFNYIYDLGDTWVHHINIEKEVPKAQDINYPLCLKGAMACPPEDCSGITGYFLFRKY